MTFPKVDYYTNSFITLNSRIEFIGNSIQVGNHIFLILGISVWKMGYNVEERLQTCLKSMMVGQDMKVSYRRKISIKSQDKIIVI